MRKYILKISRQLIVQIFFSMMYIIPIASIPYITKLLFDYDFANENNKKLIIYVIMYLLAILLGMIFQYISQIYEWIVERDFNILIKKDMFISFTKYNYTRFSQTDIGGYISIINNEVQTLETNYLEAILDLIKSIIMLIVYAVFLFIFIDKRIASVILIVSLFSIALPKFTSTTLSNRKKIHLDALAQYISKVQDLLEGFKHINTQSRYNVLNEYNKSLQYAEERKYYFGKFRTFTKVANGTYTYMLNLSAFITIAFLLMHNEITIGTGVATLGYIKSFISPLSDIIDDLYTIHSARSIKDKIVGLINIDDTIKEQANIFTSKIVFQNVTISYGQFTLRSFCYTFYKGKKYALIGHNGSGKSTIINLLMKYVVPSSGNITLDDKIISLIDTSSIMSCINQIEYVFDADFTSNTTIFDTYQKAKLPDIINYLANDQINKIANTKNCKNLSGGEKQMLQIIRMMLMDRQIILLDEPFSAMDIQSTFSMEEQVFSLENKTMIVVTHNISAEHLRYFDEIIILENGTIQKAGSYNTIIESCEYKKLLSQV